jgi:hypothetical protein
MTIAIMVDKSKIKIMATPGKYGSLPRTLFPRCEGCSLGSGDS